MKITDFLIMNGAGTEIPADPHGNNVAFTCSKCGHPVLATALENQRGSDEEHPTGCKRCGQNFFLDVRPSAEKVYIHALQQKLH
jgi:transcription elongation factor Elf1